MRLLLVVFGLLTVMSGPAGAASTAVKGGYYRLMFDTPIGPMPFNVLLERQGTGWGATLVNGPERVAVERVMVEGDAFRLEFPSYGSSIMATVTRDGDVSGNVTLTGSRGPYELPITGRFGESFRFGAGTPRSGGRVGGRWALTTTADSASSRQGLFELSQRGHVVDGTAMFFNADNRFLNGELRDGELRLSSFDGGQGSLWVGKLDASGNLAGQMWSPLFQLVIPWTARRDPQARLEDPTALTFLKPGYDKLAFTFPDLSGKPVSLSDERYKDKVVVVTIAGSWCPTCHDEAAFLAPFYEKNKARGFEVIALMYEYSPKPDIAAAAVRNFAARYAIKYEQLLAGTADRAAASNTLPMINAVLAYPTLLVVDRKGAVRQIRTGFPGPATGVHHDAFKQEFTTLVDTLLAERDEISP